MKCPRCGFEQAEAVSCGRCNVAIAKQAPPAEAVNVPLQADQETVTRKKWNPAGVFRARAPIVWVITSIVATVFYFVRDAGQRIESEAILFIPLFGGFVGAMLTLPFMLVVYAVGKLRSDERRTSDDWLYLGIGLTVSAVLVAMFCGVGRSR